MNQETRRRAAERAALQNAILDVEGGRNLPVQAEREDAAAEPTSETAFKSDGASETGSDHQ